MIDLELSGRTVVIVGGSSNIGRAAVLATFTALIVHTMAYAGFFEDPITWVLLAVGVSLAAADQRRVSACRDTSAA